MADQHIHPHRDGWAVKGDGNQKATIIYPTQEEAINRARKIAKKQRGKVIIHGVDGRVRREYTYGLDAPPHRRKAPDQHVRPRENGWAVNGDGNQKATIIYRTQEEAINRARQIAQNKKSKIFIHGVDGEVRREHSYQTENHQAEEPAFSI